MIAEVFYRDAVKIVVLSHKSDIIDSELTKRIRCKIAIELWLSAKMVQ